jgi:hypothetical protein
MGTKSAPWKTCPKLWCEAVEPCRPRTVPVRVVGVKGLPVWPCRCSRDCLRPPSSSWLYGATLLMADPDHPEPGPAVRTGLRLLLLVVHDRPAVTRRLRGGTSL